MQLMGIVFIVGVTLSMTAMFFIAVDGVRVLQPVRVAIATLTSRQIKNQKEEIMRIWLVSIWEGLFVSAWESLAGLFRKNPPEIELLAKDNWEGYRGSHRYYPPPQRSRTPLVLKGILAMALVGVVVSGAFLFFTKEDSAPATATQQPAATAQTAPTVVATSSAPMSGYERAKAEHEARTKGTQSAPVVVAPGGATGANLVPTSQTSQDKEKGFSIPVFSGVWNFIGSVLKFIGSIPGFIWNFALGILGVAFVVGSILLLLAIAIAAFTGNSIFRVLRSFWEFFVAIFTSKTLVDVWREYYAGKPKPNPTAPRPSARQMFPIVCAECGNSSEVPFQPNPARPVYCPNCWGKHKPAPGGATP